MLAVPPSSNRCARSGSSRDRSKPRPAAAVSAAASPASSTAATSSRRPRRRRRKDHLPRHPEPAPGTPCAGSRAARPGRTARPQRRAVERPRKPHRQRDHIGAAAAALAAALQPLQEPQPPLRIRQRDLGRPRPRAPAAHAPPAPPTTAAADSAATLGASNRLRIATSTSSTARIRLISRVASSECPPSSKKLSSTPTRRSPSTSANSPHRIASCGVARRPLRTPPTQAPAPAARAGRACRSASAAAAPAPRSPTAPCSPAAAATARPAAPPASSTAPGRRNHIADQPLARRAPSVARDHHRLRHARLPQQHSLDLARLDPEPAQLHLRVGPAQELQHPVGPPPRQVPGPVHPAAAPPAPPCGSATNRSAVSPARPR